jgi:hypothetical protein
MVNVQEVKYLDREIAALMKERKILPDDWRTRLYRTGSLDVEGEDGSKFRIIVRPDDSRPLDFSVILMVLGPRPNQEFKLRRYNGWTSRHRNRIEKEIIDGFHIHEATECYQRIGKKEETYAQRTDRYSDWQGALDCLIEDANFEKPPQMELF